MSHQLLVGLLTAGGLMTKRQFGTIRKLPSGRWRATRYRTESGRRVTAAETFRTPGDASRWLAKAEAEQGRGWLDPRAGEVLLADYARRWTDGRANLAPRTRETYQHQLRSHVLPRVAERRHYRPPDSKKGPVTRAFLRGRNRRRSGDLALFRRARTVFLQSPGVADIYKVPAEEGY